MPSPALAKRLLDELPLLPGALCAGEHNDAWFFPGAEDKAVADEVKALCSRCPVRPSCIGWAIIHDEPGVWGGLNRYERRQLGRHRPRASCPICGGSLIWMSLQTQTEICVGCGSSWPVGRVEIPA